MLKETANFSENENNNEELVEKDFSENENIKSIKINGLGNRYSPFYMSLNLSTNGTDRDGPYTTQYLMYDDDYTIFQEYSDPTLNSAVSQKNGTFTGILFDNTNNFWNGSESYFVLLILVDWEEYGNLYYVSKRKISFEKSITDLSFPQDFNFIKRTAGQ